MPVWHSFADFGRSLDALARDLTVTEKRAITRKMAEESKRAAVASARLAVGADAKFSGWPGEPRALDSLQIKPLRDGRTGMWPTRKSGGPWKVAELGRNRGVNRFGGATGRGGVALFQGPSIDRASGDTYRTKSGKVRMTRSRRRSKWSGYTPAKHTASEAVQVMERTVPPIAEREVRRVMDKRFTVT